MIEWILVALTLGWLLLLGLLTSLVAVIVMILARLAYDRWQRRSGGSSG